VLVVSLQQSPPNSNFQCLDGHTPQSLDEAGITKNQSPAEGLLARRLIRKILPVVAFPQHGELRRTRENDIK